MNARLLHACLLAALMLLMPMNIAPSHAQAAPPTRAKSQSPSKPSPHRVFAGSRFSIDRELARPYDNEVPFGAAGDRVWATSPQGWAFRDGVQLLYLTNLNGFDVTVRGGGARYSVGAARYTPSHVRMSGTPHGSEMAASASFTYVTDRLENPLSRPFKPEKRWTSWSSGRRDDWYAVDFGRARVLSGLDVYFFDDRPQGGCAPPERVRVELWRDGAWQETPIGDLTPQAGRNAITFSGGPQRASRVRLLFRHRGDNLYTGLYGFAPRFTAGDAPSAARRAPVPLRVSGDKWITQDDVLASRIVLFNPAHVPQSFSIGMETSLQAVGNGYAGRHEVDGFPLYLEAGGTEGKSSAAAFAGRLRPGETRTFTFACAVAATPQGAAANLRRTLSDRAALRRHIAAYQGWFDRNVAHFSCSDPRTTRMYWHRWYNLRKNSMNPRLGALRHRTFAEGRWTSDWYANVISYGAGHQIREARWLRDPSYAWGHLQTWTDNPRPDGVYPSHVTPKGQRGGQYTDWITSTAWDAYLVHPDRATLGRIADALARNAEGWRKVYGVGDSPLLVVDNHWWTGMEWQPSFFAFDGYRTDKPGEGEDLRRVDLTAYNYGNAQAVAKIYRELGRAADAARLQRLADQTRDAVLARMWNPATHWFHSLRARDNVPSPDKEIIGLYPFYFNLPPAGRGYEAAWRVALDPRVFWTAWPLASAAKDCPAYSQDGWPIGPGGSGCMWNGPSWPHANSLVLTAMANTLRRYQPGALTKAKMLELFNSFTRAQFRDGDIRYPWTGEFYNGDNGEWKTPQRDYNHSTWLDPLINDLIGIVPRADNVLEIDPLLPPGAWSHFVLDGQAYKGHDVTIAYDARGGKAKRRVAPGFKGFAVYLDGRRVYYGPRLARVRYDMATRKLLRAAPARTQ